MPVPISTMLFRRLVAERAGVDAATVARVLEAEVEVLEEALKDGHIVKISKLGALQRVDTKATRRKMPGSEDLIEVPARAKIVFKEARRKGDDE